MSTSKAALAVGKLVASLHVPRSVPGGLHPLTQAAYDEVRSAIRDFGWSEAEEVAQRLETAIGSDSEAAPAPIDRGWYERVLRDVEGVTATVDPPMETRRIVTADGEFLIVGPIAGRGPA